MGVYLEKTKNNKLIFCRLAHIISFIYSRLIGGYFKIVNLYLYMNYHFFVGVTTLYLLCYIGICGLLLEYREIFETYTKYIKEKYFTPNKIK